MKKIYKIKVNNKAYEVELQEISSVEGTIEVATTTTTTTSATPKVTMVGGEEITAPMPGTIVDVLVKAGDIVEKGQLVAILEAMKMETEILAPNAGTVTEVQIAKGATVNLGDAIATLG